jgi:uncharacterized membrane protein
MQEKLIKNAYILIFLHLLIALPLAFYLNIWMDEASTLYTTENGIAGALRNALTDEKQAPLYFWMLSLWREINSSVFFARLFSVLCSALAIRLFFETARALFPEKTAFFIAAVFALHPYLIWASLEIRVYSLVILISILLLNYFNKAYFEEKAMESGGEFRHKKARIIYILLSIFALYTNYYLGFFLAGGLSALLVTRKWSAAKRYFLDMIFAGFAFLPLLWAINRQFSANTSGFQTEKSLVEALQILWGTFLTFVLPTEMFPSEELSAISLFRLWFVRSAIVSLFILFALKRPRLNNKTFALGAISATVFACLLASYFLLGPVYIAQRHAAVVFVPLLLFAALILTESFASGRTGSKPPKLYKGYIFSVAALLTVFFSYSIYTLYPDTTKRGDWKRIGAFIEQNEKPNQPIIVFTAFDALALPYHYQGINRIFPDERFFEWELEDSHGSAGSLKKQIDFVISEIPTAAAEIWLVTNEKCEIKESCAPLENFINANYTIIETKDFYKEKLFLLRKKEQ